MNLRPILNKIGFNEKEAGIYLTCLGHGPESITNIARLSGCKRSTLYYLIEGLLKKGFLVIVRKRRKTLYDAEKPKKLLTAIRARERELEQMLPELERARRSHHAVPSVEVYEGEEGIRNVYDEIYGFINNKDEACFLTSIRDLREYAQYALDGFMHAIESVGNYKVRELIYDDEYGRKYVIEGRRRGLRHPCRLLPPRYALYNDINIFGDKVALFSFRKRSAVTIIDNREVALTMKALFEFAWRQAKEYDREVERKLKNPAYAGDTSTSSV